MEEKEPRRVSIAPVSRPSGEESKIETDQDQLGVGEASKESKGQSISHQQHQLRNAPAAVATALASTAALALASTAGSAAAEDEAAALC